MQWSTELNVSILPFLFQQHDNIVLRRFTKLFFLREIDII